MLNDNILCMRNKVRHLEGAQTCKGRISYMRQRLTMMVRRTRQDVGYICVRRLRIDSVSARRWDFLKASTLDTYILRDSRRSFPYKFYNLCHLHRKVPIYIYN